MGTLVGLGWLAPLECNWLCDAALAFPEFPDGACLFVARHWPPRLSADLKFSPTGGVAGDDTGILSIGVLHVGVGTDRATDDWDTAIQGPVVDDRVVASMGLVTADWATVILGPGTDAGAAVILGSVTDDCDIAILGADTDDRAIRGPGADDRDIATLGPVTDIRAGVILGSGTDDWSAVILDPVADDWVVVTPNPIVTLGWELPWTGLTGLAEGCLASDPNCWVEWCPNGILSTPGEPNQLEMGLVGPYILFSLLPAGAWLVVAEVLDEAEEVVTAAEEVGTLFAVRRYVLGVERGARDVLDCAPRLFCLLFCRLLATPLPLLFWVSFFCSASSATKVDMYTTYAGRVIPRNQI